MQPRLSIMMSSCAVPLPQANPLQLFGALNWMAKWQLAYFSALCEFKTESRCNSEAFS